ncbi:MAG: DUF2058 domain-containing protein [Desulfobulbaceae bacterium]|nr:MAG: DUF2058 domain-containing protein [Desulfobulbaceae bacterium]
MGNPFQDQLLKAGLVNKKQVNKAKHEKRLSKKQQQNNDEAKEARRRAEEELAARKQRDKELNRRHAEEKRRQECRAQVKQLIEQNRLAKDDWGEAYNFVEENKIKRIYVPAEVVEQLSRGQAAIVKLGQGYEVVPARVARQIAQRLKEAVVAFHSASGSE